MAKLRAKYNRWLEAMRNNDEKVRPFYITATRHWDEGDEYVIIAFNQTKEKVEEIYKLMYGSIVNTEPYGEMNIVDGRKDLSFIDEHPKLTIYNPDGRWHC